MSTTPTAAQFEVPKIPDTRLAIKLAQPVIDQSANLVIKDHDGFVASWSLVERHDNAIEQLEGMLKPFVKGLDQLHKMAVHLFDPWLNPLRASRQHLLDERTRFSREEQRKVDEQRRRDAERIQKEEAKKLEEDAKKLAKKDPETASVLREQAKNVPLPNLPMTRAVPAQRGEVVTPGWDFEITTPDDVPRNLCDPSESRIRKIVSALGDKANIPGVTVWPKSSRSSRAVRS